MLHEAAKGANPADWPALIGPAIDVMTNETWYGAPIVTESMARKLPEDQYKSYTTELMKQIGAILDVSPAQVEYLVNSYTGGLYGRVARTFELGINGPETPSDWPVVGTLILREPYRPSKKIAEFYERVELLEQKKGSDRITGRENAERLRLNRVSRNHLSPIWKELRKEDLSADRRKRLYERMERVLDSALK
jgi:hypothetical protein